MNLNLKMKPKNEINFDKNYLENSIKEYAERYASAVKTSTIIKSIENAADSVSRMVKDTSLGTDEKVKDIQSRLETEVRQVEEIIDSTSKKYVGRLQTSPETEISKVGISAQSFYDNVLTPVKDKLDKRLPKYLGVFDVHVTDEMQVAVKTDIEEIYEAYTDIYKDKRRIYLLDSQSAFINDFMEQVEISKISEETKKRLKNFERPAIPEFGLDKKIDELFDSANLFEHENIKKFFKAIANGVKVAFENVEETIEEDRKNKPVDEIVEVLEEGLDKDNSSIIRGFKGFIRGTGNNLDKGLKKSKELLGSGLGTVKDVTAKISENVDKWKTKTISKKYFIDSVTDWFQKNQSHLTDGFKKDFCSAVNQMCNDLATEFKDNIESYSTKIRALKEDNKPLELLADDIKKMQASFDSVKKELETKI